MFLIPVNISAVAHSTDISLDGTHWHYAIWPLWLIFCLMVSTTYGVLLVWRATEFASAERLLSRASTSFSSSAEPKVWSLFSIPDDLEETLQYQGLSRQLVISLQRLCNTFARAVQASIRIGRACFVFLRPPLDRKGPKFRERMRIWIGNAFAAVCCLMFFAGAYYSTSWHERDVSLFTKQQHDQPQKHRSS